MTLLLDLPAEIVQHVLYMLDPASFYLSLLTSKHMRLHALQSKRLLLHQLVCYTNTRQSLSKTRLCVLYYWFHCILANLLSFRVRFQAHASCLDRYEKMPRYCYRSLVNKLRSIYSMEPLGSSTSTYGRCPTLWTETSAKLFPGTMRLLVKYALQPIRK